MKNKWINFYSGIAASAIALGTYTASKHMAKKYGQKPTQSKLIDINLLSLIDYGTKKFVSADEEKIAKLISIINKN